MVEIEDCRIWMEKFWQTVENLYHYNKIESKDIQKKNVTMQDLMKSFQPLANYQ